MSDVPANIPVVADPLRGYLPTRAHADDAAFDLVASENVYLKPGDTRIVSCAFKMAIPEGFAGLVLPRSGLAGREGLTVLNAPGLIDPGYRGDIGVVLMNLGRDGYRGYAGDRIAQLLFIRTADVELRHSAWLPHSERADAGFGSTGVA